MRNISNNEEKIAIVSRLVKDGAIDFTEALKLLENEEQNLTIPQLPYYPQPINPWDQINPNPMWPNVWYTNNPDYRGFTFTTTHN